MIHSPLKDESKRRNLSKTLFPDHYKETLTKKTEFYKVAFGKYLKMGCVCAAKTTFNFFIKGRNSGIQCPLKPKYASFLRGSNDLKKWSVQQHLNRIFNLGNSHYCKVSHLIHKMTKAHNLIPHEKCPVTMM